MPKLAPNAVPSYRLHRQSGQAVVTLSGRDVLLGAHDSPEDRIDSLGRTLATLSRDLSAVTAFFAAFPHCDVTDAEILHSAEMLSAPDSQKIPR